MPMPIWANTTSLTQPSTALLDTGWVDNGDPPCANDMNWVLSELTQRAHVPAQISSPNNSITLSATGEDGQTFTVDVNAAFIRQIILQAWQASPDPSDPTQNILHFADGVDPATGEFTFTPCP